MRQKRTLVRLTRQMTFRQLVWHGGVCLRPGSSLQLRSKRQFRWIQKPTNGSTFQTARCRIS
jgi:hypothetical protein